MSLTWKPTPNSHPTLEEAIVYAESLRTACNCHADRCSIRLLDELIALRTDKARLQMRLDTVKSMLVSGRLEYGGPLVTADGDPHLFFLYTHNMRLKSGFTFDGAIDAATKRISVIDAARKETKP